MAIIIGLGAGLVSALLFLSAARGTADVMVLFVLSPLPVALAGFGWGWTAAAVAAVAGALVAGLVGSGRSAIVHAVAIGAPMATFAYLLMLSRPLAQPHDRTGPGHRQGDGIEWYPVGRMVAWAALWSGAITALALVGTASDVEGLRKTFLTLIDRVEMLRGPGGRAPTPDEKQNFARMFAFIFPWAVATMWLVLSLVNLWAAAHITRLSGRLRRPWPDLAGITLPSWMALAFAIAAVAATLLTDMSGLVASGFSSGIMFAFMLLGLAILHGITHGQAARPMILAFVYLSLLFFSPVSSLVVAMIGLAEPMLRHRRPPPHTT